MIIRDIVGGRAGPYENAMRDASNDALCEIEEEARRLIADAAVGINLDYEVIGEQGSMFIDSVSGAAVKLG